VELLVVRDGEACNVGLLIVVEEIAAVSATNASP
jgi:hypothetical protein